MNTFEHFAINVKDPKAISDWYCQHLGMKKVLEKQEAPFMTFLADATNRVVVELYYQPSMPITDFNEQHQLTFHFAFESDDAEKDKNTLLVAGATFIEEQQPGPGTHLVMLRDPWGLPLQLCQRAQKLI
ncbi:VOC family protein [Formosa sp. S-31]|uniref:VOC family protein n=1 Tax=Formosa sp. S-31 TaxID=2790949 RepID=UPI003EB84AB2